MESVGQDGEPYIDEALQFEIPREIDNCMFDTTSIWCTKFLLNYGEAALEE